VERKFHEKVLYCLVNSALSGVTRLSLTTPPTAQVIKGFRPDRDKYFILKETNVITTGVSYALLTGL
jgi:hypothetical protein